MDGSYAARARARVARKLWSRALLFKAGLAALILSPQAHAAPPAAPADARGAFAVYCAQTCGDMALEGFVQRKRLPSQARLPTMVVSAPPLGSFALPASDTLDLRGRGDVAGAAGAQDVRVVRWAGPTEDGPALARQVGLATIPVGAWIEDLDTGFVYDAAALTAALDGLEGQPADSSALMSVESRLEEDGTLSIRSRGLRALGLPDLVVESVSEAREGEVVLAIDAFAQVMLERGVRPELDLGDGLARWPAAVGECSVSGRGRLSYARGGLGPSATPLARLAWDGSATCPQPEPSTSEPGPAEEAAEPGPATGELAIPAQGGPDQEADARPSTLEEAQRRALRRLRGPVNAAFSTGLDDGDTLFVKAPFTTADDQVEWLWVEVDSWSEAHVLGGRVHSPPQLVADLSAGDLVEVELSYVFDYLWQRADGTQEGNTTGPFVQ